MFTLSEIKTCIISPAAAAVGLDSASFLPPLLSLASGPHFPRTPFPCPSPAGAPAHSGQLSAHRSCATTFLRTMLGGRESGELGDGNIKISQDTFFAENEAKFPLGGGEMVPRWALETCPKGMGRRRPTHPRRREFQAPGASGLARQVDILMKIGVASFQCLLPQPGEVRKHLVALPGGLLKNRGTRVPRREEASRTERSGPATSAGPPLGALPYRPREGPLAPPCSAAPAC